MGTWRDRTERNRNKFPNIKVLKCSIASCYKEGSRSRKKNSIGYNHSFFGWIYILLFPAIAHLLFTSSIVPERTVYRLAANGSGARCTSSCLGFWRMKGCGKLFCRICTCLCVCVCLCVYVFVYGDIFRQLPVGAVHTFLDCSGKREKFLRCFHSPYSIHRNDRSRTHDAQAPMAATILSPIKLIVLCH